MLENFHNGLFICGFFFVNIYIFFFFLVWKMTKTMPCLVAAKMSKREKN